MTKERKLLEQQVEDKLISDIGEYLYYAETDEDYVYPYDTSDIEDVFAKLVTSIKRLSTSELELILMVNNFVLSCWELYIMQLKNRSKYNIHECIAETIKIIKEENDND
jgi:hypothetical protein